MTEWPILSAIIFLPLLGAMFILAISANDDSAARNAKFVALWTTAFTFIISLMIWVNFNPDSHEFQFVEKYDWLVPEKVESGEAANKNNAGEPIVQKKGNGGISYHVGVDGISLLFIILTTFLMPLCILASWDSIKTRVKEYMVAFLVLETLMIGVFCSLDLVLFYLFFEGGLIPMFLIIGVWGGKRRIYASYKFFLYTFAGSVLMLAALMAMYWNAGTTDITFLLKHTFPSGESQLFGYTLPFGMQTWLWLAFFASFAVKMPMWPVHTWLPDAHVEAPTAGSVILAGVLLKMGGYGFLRFSIPMFPIASEQLAILVLALSAVAVIYTSLVALAQEDIKKLIAYSSVAHMGFVTMGLFTFTAQGIQGGIFQMLSHGIVSAALFLCVGVVYDRMRTREINAYGGLVNRMPVYAFCFLVFTMANVGLPGTSGFVGEFLSLMGAFKVNTLIALLATTGVVLSAGYALWLYRRVIFGELQKPKLQNIKDLNMREVVIIAPLVILTIFFGIYPNSLLSVTEKSVKNLITEYRLDLDKAGVKSTAASGTGLGEKEPGKTEFDNTDLGKTELGKQTQETASKGVN